MPTCTTPVLDVQMYPHFLDSIISNASHGVLLSLRATSRHLAEPIDAAMAVHLLIQMVDAPHAHLPAPKGPLYLGGTPSYPPPLTPLCPNYRARLLKSLRHTRVVDVIDILPLHVVPSLLRSLPPGGSFHILRFRRSDSWDPWERWNPQSPLYVGRDAEELCVPPQTTTVLFFNMIPLGPGFEGLYQVPLHPIPNGTHRFVINATFSPSQPELQDLKLTTGHMEEAETLKEVVCIMRRQQTGTVDAEAVDVHGETIAPQITLPAGYPKYAWRLESPSPLKRWIRLYPELHFSRTKFTFVGFESLPLCCFGVDDTDYETERLPLKVIQTLFVRALTAEVRDAEGPYGPLHWSDEEIGQMLPNIRFLSLAEYQASLTAEQARYELEE